ncbi:DUF2382 domain-containing protein [Aureimonas sp. AU20]|uniref:DUF2382 domain-containing protein n=1 Tax=Aureimonas sp. AU20 TaxID=1349819 RepID=UPI0007212DD1|nr:DUF2382 domain-containing protein [Aureimonas sp. AU20]ALN71837.1 hypothetical protein M673_03870 [Aureimonas sp. AU20]
MIDQDPVCETEVVRATDTIELLEEFAVVSKRVVTTGSLSVRTVTETFDEEVAAHLSGTKAVVERVAIDRIVETIPQTRVEGDVTIVPVFEEVLVVERRIRLVEELHIRHETTSESVRLPVSVRRQRAVIERLPVGSPAITQPNEE